MREFLLWLRTLSPRYWVQIYPTDYVWDAILRNLLETETFVKETQCTCQLGPYSVWTSSHPHASFRPDGMSILPTRRTRILAQEKLVRDLLRR